MSKRIRKSFSSNQEVCHVFVSQSQESGYTKNIFFNDDCIYSYGHHYLMGKIYKDKKTILIQEDSYSSSTAQHKCRLWNAASHLNVFYVPYPDDPKKSTMWLADKIADEIGNFFTGRSGYKKATWCDDRWSYRLTAIRADVKNFNLYCKIFNIKDSFILPPDFLKLLKEIELYKGKKENDSDSKKEQRRLEKLELAKKAAWDDNVKRLVKIKNWKTGKSNSVPCSRFNHQIFIRVKENQIETSEHANVPLQCALKKYFLLKENQNILGKRIGAFTVDKLENNVLSVGCHDLELKELDRVLGKYFELYTEIKNDKNAHASPNYVAQVAYENKLIMTTELVVAISNLL